MSKSKVKSYKFVACDLCNINNFTVFLDMLTTWEHRGLFRLVKCSNCNLVFLNPRPIDLGKYYPDEEYWGWDTKTETNDTRWNIFGPIYKLIYSKYKRGKILDIGTGSGLFLTEFKNRNWRPLGTEISEFAKNLAKNKYNLQVIKGSFTNIKFKEQAFDVITLNNVLEHLPEPSKTIAKCFKVLKKDGIIIITLPNIESLGYKIFGKNWHALQPPRHLYHFSYTTLSELLSKNNFKLEGVIYNNRSHIIYSLFESFRFMFSPKFKKRVSGGIILDTKTQNYFFYQKIFVELGKIFARSFAYGVYFIELFLGKPDVISIYASKH